MSRFNGLQISTRWLRSHLLPLLALSAVVEAVGARMTAVIEVDSVAEVTSAEEALIEEVAAKPSRGDLQAVEAGHKARRSLTLSVRQAQAG